MSLKCLNSLSSQAKEIQENDYVFFMAKGCEEKVKPGREQSTWDIRRFI